MLKAAASCVLASLKASTYSEYASALLSAAALPDDSFEHPGKNKAVSKPILGVSRWIQPQRPYSLWQELKRLWALISSSRKPFAIRYRLLKAACAALIVYSISRVE